MNDLSGVFQARLVHPSVMSPMEISVRQLRARMLSNGTLAPSAIPVNQSANGLKFPRKHLLEGMPLPFISSTKCGQLASSKGINLRAVAIVVGQSIFALD